MTEKAHLLSNKAYDILKYLALVLLPAVATLYFALAQIWKLPHAEEVVGTITAVDTFLGFLLKASTTSYNNSDAKYGGVIDVTTTPGTDDTPPKKSFSLTLNGDPAELDQNESVLFKINPTVESPLAG